MVFGTFWRSWKCEYRRLKIQNRFYERRKLVCSKICGFRKHVLCKTVEILTRMFNLKISHYKFLDKIILWKLITCKTNALNATFEERFNEKSWMVVNRWLHFVFPYWDSMATHQWPSVVQGIPIDGPPVAIVGNENLQNCLCTWKLYFPSSTHYKW